MYLDKFVHSSTGRIIMSILLGIGLATFFRQVCKGKQCKIISSPPLDELNNVFKIDNSCYNIEKRAVKCDPKKRTIQIKH